jgi:glycosyltransferase involved in cell wall biosynthesis
MQCGKPIIAVKTGGLTRQVVDYRDDTENGIALDVTQRSLVGSQMVPYIYEDYCTNEAVSDALLEMYEKGPDERERLGKKARKYVHSEFDLKTTVSDWHKTLSATIDKWENNREEIYSPWEHKVL